jgi:hypothetical protein
MKKRPIPMMMRKYVKMTARSKRLTDFMAVVRARVMEVLLLLYETAYYR